MIEVISRLDTAKERIANWKLKMSEKISKYSTETLTLKV